jgi:large subunit ribosomal protein L20
MVRVTRGNCASKRRKKILNLATGFNGAHSSSYRSANSQVMKKLVYSYNSSRERKRKFRSL